MSTLLEIKNVRHQYDKHVILDDLSLKLDEGKIGCLLGPSGSGKTTILRVVAGFEPILKGEIIINQKVVSVPGRLEDPNKRDVGIVFQDYALFPHLTVEKNIQIGLQKFSELEKKRSAEKWMEIVGLFGSGKKYPHELSGGECQRVALARAMAPQPKLLLFDEPFSNLDIELRDHLTLEVRKILKENNMTALLVTHDQNEAFGIADEIGVFNRGRIEQWGSSYQLYHEPRNRFIADFIGQGAFINGQVKGSHSISAEVGELKTDHPIQLNEGQEVKVLLRPDDVVHDDESPMKAKVCYKAFRGPYILYTLELQNGEIVYSHVHSHHNHAIGSSIGIRTEADHVVFFKADN